MKKVVFMGTPSYAAKVLDALLLAEDFEVCAVFTQPQKRAGRGQEVVQNPVKQRTLEAISQGKGALEICEISSLKEASVQEKLASFKADFIVVAAFGQLLPKAVLDLAPCVNLHASLLPLFRGASPIQAAVLKGEKLGGISAMNMREGLDDGEILAYQAMRVEGRNSSELFEEFGVMAADLTLKVLRNFDQIAPLKQFDAASSKCGKIKKEDGLVDFARDWASEICAKNLAFCGWPGTFLQNGVKLLEVELGEGELGEDKDGACGEILRIDASGVAVKTRRGVLRILRVQDVGKKPILARDFCNGKRLKVGDLFEC